jgi:hypothetical protein
VPLINIIGIASFLEFTAAPLTYAIRHNWTKLATFLIAARNEAATLDVSVVDNDDEAGAADTDALDIDGEKSMRVSIQVDDSDAVGALHLLISSGENLYTSEERMHLLRTMLGDDGQKGLCVRTLEQANFFTPGRASVITTSAQYLEDYWCCGAFLPPKIVVESLNEPGNELSVLFLLSLSCAYKHICLTF